jgi:hypothetical protein
VDYLVCALLIGAGATALMGIWAVARKWLLGIPPLDYGLVGRWLAYLARGRFRHDPIAASPPVQDERLIGWIAHYLIGIAFAAMLLALWGLDWARHPTVGPALIVGIGSVAAPFLLTQPGMGVGVAASRTPRPAAARRQSLVTHGIFGPGLYAAGWVASLLDTFQWRSFCWRLKLPTHFYFDRNSCSLSCGRWHGFARTTLVQPIKLESMFPVSLCLQARNSRGLSLVWSDHEIACERTVPGYGGLLGPVAAHGANR